MASAPKNVTRAADSDNYWLYATQSNIGPTVATATAIGDIANPGPNVVNYLSGAVWNSPNGNVTTVGSAGNTSFCGAFDMNGNVWEWNETLIGSSRPRRGRGARPRWPARRASPSLSSLGTDRTT